MAYEGAALLVSHDRYFISRVANRIVELDGELVMYRGDYNYYLEKKEEERLAARRKNWLLNGRPSGRPTRKSRKHATLP